MDANLTRYQLLLGYDDWAACTTGDGVPVFDPASGASPGFSWDAARNQVSLGVRVNVFHSTPGNQPPSIDERRGDTLRVEAVRFAATAPATMRGIDAWGIAGLFSGMIPQLAFVAAALVLALRCARPLYALLVRAVEAAGVRKSSRESAGLPPARVRGALAGEPPHVAAAVISALPAATAAAVLELYPPEERAQIVRRLARAASDLVPHPEELLRARG